MKNNIRNSFMGAALICALSGGAQASPVVLLLDDFNAEHGAVGQLNYAAFANWTVSNGTVDLIGNGFFDFIPGSGLFVDMDGSTGNAGRMTSNEFSFDAGFTYELRFDLAGNHRNGGQESVRVMVGIDGLFSEVFSLPQNDAFTTFTRTFTGSGLLAALSFEGAGGDNIGMLLDNVSLTRLETQVPEPGGLALSGLAVGALVVGLRRRKGK